MSQLAIPIILAVLLHTSDSCIATSGTTTPSTTTTTTTVATPAAPCKACTANTIMVTQNGVGAKPMDGDVTDTITGACATRTFTCLGPAAANNPIIEINNGAGVVQDGDNGAVDGTTTFTVTCNAAGTAWEFMGAPINQVECSIG